MRSAFVARERTHSPTRRLCRLLLVSVSGFYACLRRPAQPDRDAVLRAQLRAIHANSRATWEPVGLDRVGGKKWEDKPIFPRISARIEQLFA